VKLEISYQKDLEVKEKTLDITSYHTAAVYHFFLEYAGELRIISLIEEEKQNK
jgi:hypothetical protein